MNKVIKIFFVAISIVAILSGCKVKDPQVLKAKVLTEPITAIKKPVDNLAPFIEWTLSYTNGVKLKGMEYATYKNGELFIDEEKLAKDVCAATASYNTFNEPYPFATTNKGIIDISGGTYGSVIDTDAEYQEVLNLFYAHTSQTDRKPIYKKEMPDDVSSTYVEISLGEQKVWVYINGELANESLCVTGTANTSRETPTGIFYISERINGKILRGPGYATYVNKWMRLNNAGVGLHDAVWRKKFGGNIYTYDGSHGCINLPLDFASWLFDNSFVNMPVFIY